MNKIFKKGIVAICLGLYALYPTLVVYAALTDNVVAYYKLDESSGNASDSSGNGYTLTNNGTTPYVPAKINNGADGGATNSSKYLSITNNLGIDGGAMSYSCWANLTTQLTLANEEHSIVSLGSDGTDVTYHLNYMTQASVKKIGFNRLRNGIADGYLYYNTTLTPGTWYHIVTTYDGSNSRIYFNGTLVSGPTAFSGNGIGTTASRFFILNNTQTVAGYFNGIADECGVWSRALTADEVTSVYNGGVGLQYPFTPTATVPFYWNWDF